MFNWNKFNQLILVSLFFISGLLYIGFYTGKGLFCILSKNFFFSRDEATSVHLSYETVLYSADVIAAYLFKNSCSDDNRFVFKNS